MGFEIKSVVKKDLLPGQHLPQNFRFHGFKVMVVGAALLCPSRFLLPGSLLRLPPTPDSCPLSSVGCPLYWTQPQASGSVTGQGTLRTQTEAKLGLFKAIQLQVPFPPGQLLRHYGGKPRLGDTIRPCVPFPRGQSDLPFPRERVLMALHLQSLFL